MNGKKRATKEEKAKQILFACVELYIKTGKPVGSNSLKESGLEEFSSASIRNYYAELEKEGLLEQPHTSGGRIPTPKAYRLYIEMLEKESGGANLHATPEMQKVLNRDTVDLGSYLLEAANWLSGTLKTPVFLSSPRFDHDLVKLIKPVFIDTKKCLFLIVTQFGQVISELFPIDEKLSHHAEMRMEQYFMWRLHGSMEENKPEEFDELPLAEHFYRELMLRYMVRYAHFTHDEIVRSGFSHLLYSEELKDTAALASTLSLFESPKALRQVLRETIKRGSLSVWMGSEMAPDATLLALPYKIGPKTVGGVALLGQHRSPYAHWIETLYPFVDLLSKNLTFNIYQHGLTFREVKEEPFPLIAHKAPMLIENKGRQP